MAFRCVTGLAIVKRFLRVFVAGCLAGTASIASAAGPVGDAALGSRLYLQCRACHTTVAGAPHGVGPNLAGIVGAKAGTRKGYVYSKVLAASGVVWTPAVLDAWLKRPTAVVPGTKMAFAGMPAPKARQDMIAYLATLKGGK